MKRKRNSERDRQAAEFRRHLECVRDELIARGESLLTAEEWELPSDQVLRLAVERHEAVRAAQRGQMK